MQRSTNLLIAACFLLVVGFTSTSVMAATVQINDDEALIDVQLGNSLGVDIRVSFQNVIGLTETALGVSARVIDPTDTDILFRLPNTTEISIPEAFPVIVSIEPPAQQGLSFTGAYTLELHTQNLHYLPYSPFRLMKSHDGGPFVDITDNVGAGSVRARGRSGGFSEFIIVADLRALDVVAADKFDLLESRILQSDMDASIRSTLLGTFTTAANQFDNGDLLGAVNSLDQLILSVHANAGSQIPNIWRSSQDLDNVAGNIIGQAASLRYTLGIANTQNELDTALGVQ